jgi:hypothetical protein
MICSDGGIKFLHQWMCCDHFRGNW